MTEKEKEKDAEEYYQEFLGRERPFVNARTRWMKDDFKAGFDAAIKYLSGKSGEFDDGHIIQSVAIPLFKGKISYGQPGYYKELNKNINLRQALLEGARWQHSQSQLQIAALKARIEELEEYKSMYEGLCK